MQKNILIIHNNGNGNRKNANCAYGGAREAMCSCYILWSM